MLSFNKIVNILWRKKWKIIFKTDIYEIIDPEKKEQYISKVNKSIYRLKIEWYIISPKSGVYIVPDEEDKKLNKIEIIDKYYFQLIKKYISTLSGSKYYISGIKALEIHNKNYSIPDKLYILNAFVNKRVIIGDYELIFKTISWKKDGKKINIFPKFFEKTLKKEIDWQMFRVAGIELSLVESTILTDIDESLDIKLIKRSLKKYKNVVNSQIFYEIGKYKYIMSFNRLKELSRDIDTGLYMIFLDVIKQNGGLFIWEWLRGF